MGSTCPNCSVRQTAFAAEVGGEQSLHVSAERIATAPASQPPRSALALATLRRTTTPKPKEIMDNIPLLVVSGLLGLCILASLVGLLSPWLLKPGKGQGDHVAEVWLEWSLGRGSTMYRQRFATQKRAYLYVRVYAWALDLMLPRHYSSTDRYGRRIALRHDMSIMYGVRLATDAEKKDFQTIWSPGMPGTPAYSGEHADFHPLVVPRDQVSSTKPNLLL